MKCDKCGGKAVYFRRYSGQYLCSAHFEEYFEEKVRKTLLKEKMLRRSEDIGIAFSGGKDSVVTLFVLNKLAEKLDLKLSCISIDEGIKGYRDKSLEIANSICSRFGVQLHIASFKEHFGYSLDEMVASNRACTYCGVLRRRLLNEKARELDVDKLATGHNLDDEVQAIMMNYLRGDVERLARLGTPARGNGFIARIKPLSKMPEKEVALYAILKDLGPSFDECPYSASFRTGVRDFVNKLEKENPGIKFSILKGYEKITPYLENYERAELKRCMSCGEPSSQEICNACKLLDEVRSLRQDS
ncbi:MAG: TIGR00269 family protein [Candidatus Hydrothermarchaeales archaeon]